MTTTIQKWGNSQGIRLPKVLLDRLFLSENDKVELVAENDSIILKKATRKRRANKSLEERFKGYSGNYLCNECDWGEPLGNEVW